jgi:hypothetical protein
LRHPDIVYRDIELDAATCEGPRLSGAGNKDPDGEGADYEGDVVEALVRLARVTKAHKDSDCEDNPEKAKPNRRDC